MSTIKPGAARRLGLRPPPRAALELCGPLSERQAENLVANLDRFLEKYPALSIVDVDPTPGQRRGWWMVTVR